MSAPNIIYPPSSGGGGGGVSGTGTPNRIPIWNGATSLSDSPLSFSGSTLATTSALTAINFSAATQTWTLPNNAFALAIQGTSGNATLKLDTNNRYVGVDSPSSPADKFHIAESGALALRMQNTVSGTYWQHKVDASGNWGLAVNGGTNAATVLAANGNVGIGTASPSYPLHVGAGNNTGIVTTGPTAYVATNGATSLVVRDATNGIESFIYAGSSVVLAGSASAHAYQIRTSNNTRITVSATGDTSIANTLSFNSGFGSAAVAYGTRVWVNFNGTGIISIRGSGNVSSVADGGTGVYTVNFTSAMPDSNYAVTASAWYDGVAAGAGGVTSRSTTSVTVKTVATQTAALVDMLECHFSIFR